MKKNKEYYIDMAFEAYEKAMSSKRKHEYLRSLPKTIDVPNKQHWLDRTSFDFEMWMNEYKNYIRKASKCA